MNLKQLCAHRAVRPSLNTAIKQDVIGPSNVPSLRIIDELLQLHSGHLATALQDVLRYIKNIRHWSTQTFQPPADWPLIQDIYKQTTLRSNLQKRSPRAKHVSQFSASKLSFLRLSFDYDLGKSNPVNSWMGQTLTEVHISSLVLGKGQKSKLGLFPLNLGTHPTHQLSICDKIPLARRLEKESIGLGPRLPNGALLICKDGNLKQ